VSLRQLVGLLWTSDQPVAKASTDSGQHSTETQKQTSMPRGIRTHDPSNQAAKTNALNRAATGTCTIVCAVSYFVFFDLNVGQVRLCFSVHRYGMITSIAA
jgi:hypothetical protein